MLKALPISSGKKGRSVRVCEELKTFCKITILRSYTQEDRM